MPVGRFSVASLGVRQVRTTQNEGLIVSRYDKNNTTILVALLIVIRDDESFRDLWESRPVIDHPDEGAAQRVHGLIRSGLKRSKTCRVDDVLSVVLLKQLVFMFVEIAGDVVGDELAALGLDEVLEPWDVDVGVDDGRDVLIRVHDAGLLAHSVLRHEKRVAFKPRNLGESHIRPNMKK